MGGATLSFQHAGQRSAGHTPVFEQWRHYPPGRAQRLQPSEDIPAVPGAYVLALSLTRPLTITIGGAARMLSVGRYLYCGSAYGPGGLRARIARHFRRTKPVRWHVDRLTTAGQVRGAWIFPGGDECALARSLAHLPAPIPGFGSSDCRNCRSHLFYWPTGVKLHRHKELPTGAQRALRDSFLPA